MTLAETTSSNVVPLPGRRTAPQAFDPHTIRVTGLVKEFNTDVGRRRVLDNISFTVSRGERMAILGRNGAGKSTLIRILSGLMDPTAGDIHLGLRLSWPLALGGGFEGALTGYDNVRFICSIYDVPLKPVLRFVLDFTELGDLLYTPVRAWSSGMMMRLAFAMSLAIEFECLLIDEVLFVGDQRFQQKCQHEIFVRRKHQSMIIAIHSPEFVKHFCTSALVLKGGRGRVFNDPALAASIYATL